MINQGDIYWIDLGTPIGSAPGYRHPYVIVQNNFLNHSRLQTVVVCGLSSNLRRAGAPGNVLLDALEANLERQSVVLVSQLYTVDKGLFDECIGTLPSKRVRQILDGIRLITEPREMGQP